MIVVRQTGGLLAKAFELEEEIRLSQRRGQASTIGFLVM